MGQAIVKAAKDRDLYLVWSSVVDAPIFIGDRESVLAELRAEPRWAPYVDEAMDRADRLGSSARGPFVHGWDDEALTVMEGSPRDGWYRIRRDRLVEYAEALLVDDEAAAVALLECWHRIGDLG